MLWINETFLYGFNKKLSVIQPENKTEEILGVQVPVFQQREKFGRNTGRIKRSFFPFLFAFRRLYFGKTVVRGKMVRSTFQDSGKEVIKRINSRCISKRKFAEYGIQRSLFEHTVSDSNRSHFQL